MTTPLLYETEHWLAGFTATLVGLSMLAIGLAAVGVL